MFRTMIWNHRWRKADRTIRKMKELHIRKIEIERFGDSGELTFYWDDGNTEEPWGPQELVWGSKEKTFLYKKFGIY